jgi:hypothetical protein
MKIITKAGGLMLAGVFLTGAVGCKKAAQPAQNKPAANTAANTAVNIKKDTFRTEEKTPNGDDIYKLESGGVRFIVPKTWTATPDASEISLATDDNSLRMVMWVPENTDYDGVVNSLPEELGRYIQNAKPADVAARTTLNGMPALTQSGEGDMDDAQVKWKIDVLKAKRPIIILSYTTVGDLSEQHNAEYFSLMDSIRPVS